MQKRQTLEKGSAFIRKRYHNQLKRCQNSRYIAGIKSGDNKKGRAKRPYLFTWANRIWLFPQLLSNDNQTNKTRDDWLISIYLQSDRSEDIVLKAPSQL